MPVCRDRFATNTSRLSGKGTSLKHLYRDFVYRATVGGVNAAAINASRFVCGLCDAYFLCMSVAVDATSYRQVNFTSAASKSGTFVSSLRCHHVVVMKTKCIKTSP